MFLHSMLFEDNSSQLIADMHDFLGICEQVGMRAGFVFFDDCWDHSGANLSSPCVPQKGLHNGCWKASPQDWERTNVSRFQSYVSDIISEFRSDSRVAWWEVFNEPSRTSNFSASLRHKAFQWAVDQRPTQPVMACWDDNRDTQAVDHHQYFTPWGLENTVFVNPEKGGIVTEAGARWYQKYPADSGNPLTVLNWVSALRDNSTGNVPFVPGVMINWEVMTGHSQTRWHWGDALGSAEPPIPWHSHLFPDGTPVSFTEAAACRRYTTGQDDFIFVNTFLSVGDTASDEKYLTLNEGQAYAPSIRFFLDALVELTIWPVQVDGIFELRVGCLSLQLNSTMLQLSEGAELLGEFDVSKLEGGLVLESWNMLRLRVKDGKVQVWFNPQFPDVTGASVPPGDLGPIKAMPPRIEAVSASHGRTEGNLSVVALLGDFRVDYLSVLPPTLYGIAAVDGSLI
mmetsp:Transcript_59168/g.127457  ORF Transcript_59168/g.127457 Transcript_59168/m.127457 type:complete len:455 (+) Transcript_59168:53-1417(+)